ncbi:MAG TPA: prepilin-type N-terminal cleavage/methylation domain-containing protein [Phycisphaerae bacterium]|nr:prepilin-type N-terminal cleavage/methylation domain-containing protein [Phycisphaerae bacterium]
MNRTHPRRRRNAGASRRKPSSHRHAAGVPPARSRRRGLTLVELVAGLSITAILLLATLSAVTLATRAMPGQGDAVATALDSAAAIDMLTADLQYDTSYTEQSENAVTFSVADRNGDQLPETIRYAWSGTPGEPLTRTYNGGPAVRLVDQVREFSLQYEDKLVRCALRAGDNSSSRLVTGFLMLNQPEQTGP